MIGILILSTGVIISPKKDRSREGCRREKPENERHETLNPEDDINYCKSWKIYKWSGRM